MGEGSRVGDESVDLDVDLTVGKEGLEPNSSKRCRRRATLMLSKKPWMSKRRREQTYFDRRQLCAVWTTARAASTVQWSSLEPNCCGGRIW
jgi:hypothetical protein